MKLRTTEVIYEWSDCLILDLDRPVLHLTSPIPKTVNHYMGIRVVKKGNKSIPMTYVTPEAKKYKLEFIHYIRKEVKKQGWDKVNNKYCHLYMDGVFYMPKTNMDAANCDKILSDAITESGVVWDDDSGILFRPQRIYYDTQNPRIELTIHPVEYYGIFESKESAEKFEHNCRKCKRYMRNCSLLRKAFECRICEEIDMNGDEPVCEKFNPKDSKEQ